jgi:hypothetical protein
LSYQHVTQWLQPEHPLHSCTVTFLSHLQLSVYLKSIRSQTTK